MKILYIATSFPAPDNGATIYTDLAEALHEAGHEITVVVSEKGKKRQPPGIIRERGFDVLRIPTGSYYDVGFIQKGITTLKIPVLMKNGMKKHLNRNAFDMILFEAPPVTTADLVSWARKYFDCPAYLMLKDIFPQNAVDLGILRTKGVLIHYFREKEKKLYRTSDMIGCMSPANRQYIIDHNPWLDPGKVELFPNTKRINREPVAADELHLREKLGIPENDCVFLFGGNMGRPQCIDLLCDVLRACRDEKGIWFLFAGRGTDRHLLEECIEEEHITNAIVMEDLPRDEYERVIGEADVGLIVLDPRFTIPNYPSRILSYMEYAKPVLAATDHASDIRDLIDEARCGEWVWSGDVDAFVAKIREVSVMEGLPEKGRNGREYMENNFRVQRSVAILESHFDKAGR